MYNDDGKPVLGSDIYFSSKLITPSSSSPYTDSGYESSLFSSPNSSYNSSALSSPSFQSDRLDEYINELKNVCFTNRCELDLSCSNNDNVDLDFVDSYFAEELKKSSFDINLKLESYNNKKTRGSKMKNS